MKKEVNFKDLGKIKVFDNELINIAKIIPFDVFMQSKGFVRVKPNVWANRNGLEVVERRLNVDD